MSPDRVTTHVSIPLDGLVLSGQLTMPVGAESIVVEQLACGCIRDTARAEVITHELHATGTATLRLALLTPSEAAKDTGSGYWSFDLELLTRRLLVVTEWLTQYTHTRNLAMGYLATSTGAAAALLAAAELRYLIKAVVARSGRPDFAGETLRRVTAPTLFVVGERDEGILDFNRRAFERLVCPKQLAVIANASHTLAEPGALEEVASATATWFLVHLTGHHLSSAISAPPREVP